MNTLYMNYMEFFYTNNDVKGNKTQYWQKGLLPRTSYRTFTLVAVEKSKSHVVFLKNNKIMW